MSVGQKPSVGRVVHYFHAGQALTAPMAATVTAVLPTPSGADIVSLSVLVPGKRRVLPLHNVPYSDEPRWGCWSWPPRVP